MTQAKIDKKRQREQAMMGRMIARYCHKKHGTDGLCAECEALRAYSHQRSEHCPRMAEKSFCLHCPSPCYCEDMRTRVRQVMRYCGPRMLLHEPVTALRHGLHVIKHRPRKRKA